MEFVGTALATCLYWGERNRMLLTLAFVLWLASLLIALIWPLPGLDDFRALQTPGSSDTGARQTQQDEVLDEFLGNTRWGVSLQEIIERSSVDRQRVVNPVLRKMGYVGLITTLESNEVLLLMPEGGTQRLTIGDSLPDGRELVAISENSLTLQNDQLNQEVLVLFPELPPEMPEYPVKIEDAVNSRPLN